MAKQIKKRRKRKSRTNTPRTKQEKRVAQAKQQKMKRLKRQAEDQERYERADFPAIGLREILLSWGALAVISVAWILSARTLYVQSGLTHAIQLGSFFFACVLWLYVVRCMLESRRRYGVVTLKSMWYYSQTSIYSLNRSVAIFIVVFAALMVLRWLFPSPTLSSRGVACMDIAGAYYLSYIYSTYYNKEQLPYKYMETLFLILIFISPYLVYFLNAAA